MKWLWMISFLLNLFGAALNSFAGVALQSGGLLLLATINAAYAIYSVHKIGDFNEVQQPSDEG